MVEVKLPRSIEKRLDALAERTGQTKSFYIREAILRHISDLEDFYLARYVKERISNREELTYTLNEVIREFDFDKTQLEDRTVRELVKSTKKAR
jgi:RHH-type rel operon transcriptional repressor/antitoxin RelB